MKIYVVHSTAFDYQKLLYKPLQELQYENVEFIFPHSDNPQAIHSQDIIKKVDMLLAEVSYPSTGMGIELGWANSVNKPIIAIYQEEHQVSSSLSLICHHIVSYRQIYDINLSNILQS